MFAAALGMSRKDAGALRDWLLQLAANSGDAVETGSDAYRQRFEILAEMRYVGRNARLRSAWMIRTGEDLPRLVSVLVE